MAVSDGTAPGYTERVEINGVIMPRISCTYTIERSVFNSRTDVDGPFHRSAQDGLKMTGSVQCQRGVENNPHADPWQVMDLDVERVDMKIYPLGPDYDPYILVATITNFQGNSNAQQGPVAFTFNFESFGEFTVPKDAAFPG